MASLARFSFRRSAVRAALRWGTLAALLTAPTAGLGIPAYVAADTSASTNTVVTTTSVTGGHIYEISGGVDSGVTRYHRFGAFNTADAVTDGLKGVFFNQGFVSAGSVGIANVAPQNLVVAVSDPNGARLAVPIVLSNPANLIVMSPFGLAISGGAGFGSASAWGQPVTPLAKVSLSTANSLSFSNNTPQGPSIFEVLPQAAIFGSSGSSGSSGFPDGTPDLPGGLSNTLSSSGAVVLDGRELSALPGSGPVTLVVGQELMVASLVPLAPSSLQENLQPVQVLGQVTLKTLGSQGQVVGSFQLGEWVTGTPGSWSPAMLIADSNASTMSWMAPVEVTPGSQFVLAGGSGSIDLSGLVTLNGQESNGVITFANLVSASGTNEVLGGLRLGGAGRVAVDSGDLVIQGRPSTAIYAVYPQEICTTGCLTSPNAFYSSANSFGSQFNAFNLLFDVDGDASATVNGSILLGAGGLSKLGAGLLTLNGPENAYTGPTNVQGGHLQVNGPVPMKVTCAGGGTSNRCAAGQDPEFPPQDLALVDEEAGILTEAVDPDPAGDAEFTTFDSGSGEGSIAAPDLDVEVAVNDSFVVPGSEGGADGGSEPGNGTTAQDADTATAPDADLDPGTEATAEASADPETDNAADGDAGGDEAAGADELDGPTVTAFTPDQAGESLVIADGQATRETVQSLAPELGSSGLPPTPTPQQLQGEMQRQVQAVQTGGGGQARALLGDPRADEANWIASTDLLAVGPLPPTFEPARYQPAVVHIRFSEERPQAGKAKGTDAFLDITLVPLSGPVEGRRVELSKAAFSDQLRQLYASLSRQDSLDVANPKAPVRQLYNTLIAPIAPLLQARGVTTLLIAADRGLQAVPFAALHDGGRYLGDRYAFAITPSLALTNLSPGSDLRGQTLLAAGASRFDGLAPLPLVPQELDNVGSKAAKDLFLNRDFTPDVLLEKAGDPRYGRVHVATHAEFLPGGPAASYLYSGVGPIPLSTFTRLRQQRKGAPLDLISFSACRTALGDPSSELGFAGLAVQAGARSAAGTLWYVDDVATSAYFQQLYRHLGQGVPKAEALQLTRQAFMRGLIRLEGDRVLAPDGAVLLQNLTSVQQRRVRDGFQNPYFWAGIELVGAPW